MGKPSMRPTKSHATKPARLAAVTIALALAATVQANPIPYSEESIASGAQVYKQYCTECHGKDGRAQMDVISDATNLTEPLEYYNGSTQADIFNSIKHGAGVGMPPWSAQINDDDTWHLVNFIRSLWTDEQRSAFD
jgi:mono/diheme cytochrome c family protein